MEAYGVSLSISRSRRCECSQIRCDYEVSSSEILSIPSSIVILYNVETGKLMTSYLSGSLPC